VSTRQRYKPFGEQRGATNVLPSERGFVGQVEDTATGLSYLNARHYDAKNATFLGVDPLLTLTDPLSLNPFIYARNSPATLSDPTGLRPMIDDSDRVDSNPKVIVGTKKPQGASTKPGAKVDPFLPKKAIAPGSEFYAKGTSTLEGHLMTEEEWEDAAVESEACIFGFCTFTSKLIERFFGTLYDSVNGYEYDGSLELEIVRTWTFVGDLLDYQLGLPSVLPRHGLVSETRQYMRIIVGAARSMVFPDPMTTTIPTEKVSRPADVPVFRNESKYSFKSGERFRPGPYDKRYRPGGSYYEAY
jgi:RHS repeat-associated protein